MRWKNILCDYQHGLTVEPDSDKQYNYHVPHRILSHNEKMHSIEFLTRMAILVYSLMNKEALVVVDCSVGGGTEMLPIWADQHIKRWIITNNTEMTVGMDSIYLFKLHYYFDTEKYGIECGMHCDILVVYINNESRVKFSMLVNYT